MLYDLRSMKFITHNYFLRKVEELVVFFFLVFLLSIRQGIYFLDFGFEGHFIEFIKKGHKIIFYI